MQDTRPANAFRLNRRRGAPDPTDEYDTNEDSNTISQNKLKDAGFTITRDKSKADVIVIEDIYKFKNYYSTANLLRFWMTTNFNINNFIDEKRKNNFYKINLESNVNQNNYLTYVNLKTDRCHNNKIKDY